jgi:rubrerythrin
MSLTNENLQTAFAGESQANRKYLAYAKRAEQDGYPQVAKLFRAAAAAETVHAFNHFKAMSGVKTTEENLKDAIAGEHYEAIDMYPGFLAEAKASGEKKAETTFHWALEVEKVHEQLYTQALEALTEPAGDDDYYVCPVCGYTHRGSAPDKCPVCGTVGSRFERIS